MTSSRVCTDVCRNILYTGVRKAERQGAVSDTRIIGGREYTVVTLPPKLPKSNRNRISSRRIRARAGRDRQRAIRSHWEGREIFG
jgi:hypothetical protein